jgi:hypothetical protein
MLLVSEAVAALVIGASAFLPEAAGVSSAWVAQLNNAENKPRATTLLVILIFMKLP